jgi:hypothetical protein
MRADAYEVLLTSSNLEHNLVESYRLERDRG